MALPGVAAGSSVSRDDHERNVRGGGTSRTSMQSRMSSQNDVYRSLRSSMSSSDEEAQHRVMSMSKRWTTLETVGRCMFLFSVAFFIVGVLITVFGFSNTGIDKSQQVPLQVLGPTCLAMTVVMWIIGCVFSRLWNLEWKRQQQAFELRDRVQLHALAMDILNNPVISPGMLQDPRMRRQLLLKLRQQKAIDISSEISEKSDRRSSRAPSMDSRRRQSSIQYEKLLQKDYDHRKRSSCTSDYIKPAFDLPGIHISRIETLDFGDGRASISSSRSSRSRGSRQYIIIHSDMASDFSRLSCPSDYSLAGSRSSRSRSSRASSQVSSRLWDFSPRDSEWDADISLGSRESQLSIIRHDWGGGPSNYYRDDSPGANRKLSVVTFDTGSPSFRRHSSPAYATRRKESVGSESNCPPKNEYPSALKSNRDQSYHSLRFNDGVRIVDTTNRKRSADMISCKSLKIDEDEREYIDYQNHVDPQSHREHDDYIRRDSLRPPLRRNNTDDSEVERRVARLFKEIEFSVSDSVDESKIHSMSSEFDYCPKRVDAREAETQTHMETCFLEPRIPGNTDLLSISYNESSRKNSSTKSTSECSAVSVSFSGASSSGESGKRSKKSSTHSFEKTWSTISNAISSLGRRTQSEVQKTAQQLTAPRGILAQGLSLEEREGVIKSPPPKYEDVINSDRS